MSQVEISTPLKTFKLFDYDLVRGRAFRILVFCLSLSEAKEHVNSLLWIINC